jgi:uncharacterized membrane protein
VLAIRLLALFLVFLALTGASCISRDDLKVPSTLLIVVDKSESMSLVRDELEGRSRWQYLKETLRNATPLFEKLHNDHKINVVFFSFGDEFKEWNPFDPDEATGKRTDTAQALRTLHEKYRGEKYLRGVVLLSDGADNVASDPSARALAATLRTLPCPVFTVAFGSKAVNAAQNDIVVTSLNPEPPIVAVKGKLTVRATIDALGFINSQVRVKVFINDREIKAQDETLKLRKDNLVEIVCDAPAEPGEIKVTLKVHRPDREEALAGELSAANNEMSTFVTVSREGLSVLVIDRPDHFFEPQALVSALKADRRMRVYTAWLRGPQVDDARPLLQFDQQPFDVIILGDVTAARLREADPDALAKILDRVSNKRTGLLMMGGRYAFGNGDWRGTEIEKMLPVRLNQQGQNATRVRLKPTDEGLRYVLRIADRPEESRDKWSKMPELRGYTPLGEPLGRERIFAETEGGQPLMVAHDYGTGRVMTFAGDTTHFWRRPIKQGNTVLFDGDDVHSRFWRQVVLWLARQEDTDDNLRIRLDTRRLRTGDNLGFGVEIRGKQGETLKDTRFQTKVVDPKGNETPVEVVPGLRGSSNENESRGKFVPKLPGEYRVVVSGSGTDPMGKKVDGRSEARFIAYQDDAESMEKAANPDFLKDLASAGGGRDYRPGELKKFLEQLPSKPLPQPPPKPAKIPDWRTSKGPSPFLLAFFLLFVQLLALEWFLRRRWGMV